MIKKINIKNFRSIKDQEIELPPLTVIVGANNTGKSNLIKALEFIGDIARSGLHRAVINRGGFEEIIPKVFTKQVLYSKSCSIDLEFVLPPKTEPTRDIVGQYQLSFIKNESNGVKIKTEKTTFNDVLWLGSIAKKDSTSYDTPSSLNIELKGGGKKFRPDPVENEKNIDLYLNWLLSDLYGGKEPFKGVDLKEKKEFFNYLMYYFLQTKGVETFLKDFRIIEDEYTSIFQTILAEICPQVQQMKSKLSRINRYDLLIQELRKEQAVTSEKILNKHGSNLPPRISEISKKDKNSWERIVDTLTAISPTITNIDTDKLRTIKEYVYFKEIFGGREIESWESSDGSLRALGILLALESQEKHSTLLIEEPEIGLHPWAIDHLFDHMRELIDEKPIQVILTTHSDKVLENANKNEVLVCSRDEDGTKFQKINEIKPDIDEDMVTIGRLWRKGRIGGVPE